MRGAIHSIVLANDSRLLRDMFSRVIKKRSSLIEVAQIEGNAKLRQVLFETGADCVITTLHENNDNGVSIENIINDNQDVLFVFIDLDDRTVLTQRAGEKRSYEQLSLPELIDILERD